MFWRTSQTIVEHKAAALKCFQALMECIPRFMVPFMPKVRRHYYSDIRCENKVFQHKGFLLLRRSHCSFAK